MDNYPKNRPSETNNQKSSLTLNEGEKKEGEGSITALILAAGEARRFGRPKQLLPWGNQETILSRVVKEVLITPGICTVKVVLGAWFDEITTVLASTLNKTNVIRNREWQTGMFSSLRAGLEEIADYDSRNRDNDDAGSDKIDGIIVLLGDMPFITTQTLTRFVNTAEDLEQELDPRPIIATEAGRPAHPYLIRRTHIGKILSLSGESGIRPFIQKEFPEALKIEVENSVGRRDIDTWESYFKNRPPDSGEIIPPPPN